MKSYPLDLTWERDYWHQGYQRIVGIDEVGRGALAGPVVAAAVIFPEHHQPIEGVQDSKTLTPLHREQLDKIIRSRAFATGIGQVEAETIDRIGILQATGLAMHQACQQIGNIDFILVDGPLHFGLDTLCTHVEPIVKGDQKIYSIAVASIVAKVYRDRLMTALAQREPGYEWGKNKGYGTQAHFKMIRARGLSTFHRQTFIHLP